MAVLASISSNLLYIALLPIILYILLSLLFKPKVHANEPPILPPRFPFFGHLISLLIHRSQYHNFLRRRLSNSPQDRYYPACTLILYPGSNRIYLITSQSLVSAVQRNSKTISFAAIGARFTGRICGSSKEARDLLMVNPAGIEEGRGSLLQETTRTLHVALSAGKEGRLAEVSELMVKSLGRVVEGLVKEIGEAGGMKKVGLLEFVRHAVTMAATDAIYGPENPFKDPKVERGFWDFERNVTMLIIDIFPSLTAPKANRGRETFVKAFENYFSLNGGWKQASALIKGQVEIYHKYGVSPNDIARFELAEGLALLANTVPAAFWTLFYIYRDPKLLDDVRAEVGRLVQSTVGEKPNLSPQRFALGRVKESCLLLASVFQEALRVQASVPHTRLVLEDTYLDNRFLVRKDNVIQMPPQAIHFDASVYGSNAYEFNPRRFLRPGLKNTMNGNGQDQAKIPPSAFRSFGGGVNYCPGRHFAHNEVLSFVAIFIMRFVMTPAKGEWMLPELNFHDIAASVASPLQDVRVNIQAETSSSSGTWEYTTEVEV